jgi:hypothetical protein
VARNRLDDSLSSRMLENPWISATTWIDWKLVVDTFRKLPTVESRVLQEADLPGML